MSKINLKTIGKYRCSVKGCDKKYNNRGLLKTHIGRKHEEIFATFYSLLNSVSQWGYKYEGSDAANEFRKNPHDYALQMSVLLHILDVLKEIRYELRQDKKIIN